MGMILAFSTTKYYHPSSVQAQLHSIPDYIVPAIS